MSGKKIMKIVLVVLSVLLTAAHTVNEEVEGRELLLEYLVGVPTEEIFYPRTGVMPTKDMPEGLISKQAWKSFAELKE